MEFTLDFPGFGGSTAKKKATPKKVVQKKTPQKRKPSASSKKTSKEEYEDAVIRSVLRLSHEKTNYNKAKQEWKFSGEVVDHGPIREQKPTKHCQFCGHNIRHGYILGNTVNKRRIEVGSECVYNFVTISPTTLNAAVRKLEDKRAVEYKNIYYGASSHVNKLIDHILKQQHGGSSEQYRAMRTWTNNEAVLYKAIKGGKVQSLAKDKGFKLDTKRLTLFVKMYEKAPKRAGFIAWDKIGKLHKI